MLQRRAFEKSMKLHHGEWDKMASGCKEVRGKKLGIIGYGNIGSQLSILAEALGMEVLYYDVAEKMGMGNAKCCARMDELLKKADIITIHVDGRKENKSIMGSREFKMMKPGVIFLNLSRGFIVDIDALADAVRSGKVSGAAVDVFPEEPIGSKDVFASPLCGLPNVILTPHVGGNTEEAQQGIAAYVAEKIVHFVNTGSTTGCVNLPNIQLSQPSGAHRLIHLHRNVPGILSQINTLLANHRMNIVGQYLKTNDETGYVITDVSKEYDTAVLAKMKEIPETIKFRVLY